MNWVKAGSSTKKMMIWFWDNYLPDQKKRTEIYASPLQASLE